MRIGGWIAALGLLLVAPVTGSAQPVPVPDTWGGDLLSRPRLTGSWGGFRDEMGKKGIVLDVDFILTPQAVATGGVDTGAHFWGNAEYTLNVDTQKAGLWPGGFLKIVGESGFGDSILEASGALVPPEHRAPPARSPSDQRADERDLHAVPESEVRSRRGQALPGRRRARRVHRQLPHPIREYGADLPHGRRPRAALLLRWWCRRHPVGEPDADGVGGRSRRESDERRPRRGVPERRHDGRQRAALHRSVRSRRSSGPHGHVEQTGGCRSSRTRRTSPPSCSITVPASRRPRPHASSAFSRGSSRVSSFPLAP